MESIHGYENLDLGGLVDVVEVRLAMGRKVIFQQATILYINGGRPNEV